MLHRFARMVMVSSAYIYYATHVCSMSPASNAQCIKAYLHVSGISRAVNKNHILMYPEVNVLKALRQSLRTKPLIIYVALLC